MVAGLILNDWFKGAIVAGLVASGVLVSLFFKPWFEALLIVFLFCLLGVILASIGVVKSIAAKAKN